MRINAAVLLLFLPVAAAAQADADSTRVYLLDPVTVTATGFETLRSTVATAISVIPREVLLAQREKSIMSIVGREIPGTFVPERGVLGFGLQTGAGEVSIRGVGGSPNTQVLVLVDGRPQFQGLFGHTLPDSYLSASADRVEVLRGPASVLYGSNAMGGVINIVTRRPERPGFTGDATATYGTYNSAHLGGSAGYSTESWNVLASVHREQTDGHRPESAFRSTSGTVKASGVILPGWTLSADGSMTAFRTNDPGPTNAPKVGSWYDVIRSYAGVSLRREGEIASGAINAMFNTGDHAVFDGFRSKDFCTTVSAMGTFRLLPSNALTAGVEYQRFGGSAHNVTFGDDFGEHTQEQAAVYADMHQTLIERLILSAGLRVEHNSTFGNELVPQAGASVRVTESGTLRASASKGFRSPTIRELYLFPAPTPDLKPERLWNYEIGWTQTAAEFLSVDLSAFLAEGSNLLRPEFFPVRKYTNSGAFIHRGAELSCTALVAPGARLNGSYSFLEPGDETRSIPRHKLFLGGSTGLGRVTLAGNMEYVAGIHGSDFGKDPLPEYVLVELRAAYSLQPGVTLTLSGDNLLDKSYQTILGYPMPGRTFTVGIQAGL